MPNNTPTWDETQELTDVPSFEDTTPVEEPKKKVGGDPSGSLEEPSGSVGSDNSAVTPTTTPNLLGVFNKKEEYSLAASKGVSMETFKSVADAAKEAEYPTKFLFEAKELQSKVSKLKKYFPELASEIEPLDKLSASVKPSTIALYQSKLDELESKASQIGATVDPMGVSNVPVNPIFDAYKDESTTPTSIAIKMVQGDTEAVKKAAGSKGQTKAGQVISGIEEGIGDYAEGYTSFSESLKGAIGKTALVDKIDRLQGNDNAEFSTEERMLLQSLAENQQEHEQLDKEVPLAYKIGEGAGMSAGYMLEFALTGKAGAGLAGKLITKTGTTAASSAAKRLSVGLAAKMAQTGIQVGVMPTLYKKTAEKVAGGENFSTALFESYYTTFGENLSERLFLSNPWKAVPTSTINQAFRRMGVNLSTEKGGLGVLKATFEEAAEEKVGEIINAPVEASSFTEFWDRFWDAEQNKVMFGSVALMVGAPGSAAVATSKALDMSTQFKIDRLSQNVTPDIKSEIDAVMAEKELSMNQKYDLVGGIIRDRATTNNLGPVPGQTAGDAIAYAQAVAVQSVSEAVVEQIEKKAERETPELKEGRVKEQNVFDFVGQRVVYRGKDGELFQEGDVLLFEGSDGVAIELGNSTDLKDETPASMGIEKAKEREFLANSNGGYSIYGNEYTHRSEDPISDITLDDNGDVVNVRLFDQSGKEKTFRGNTAEQLAYEITLENMTDEELVNIESNLTTNSDLDEVIERSKRKAQQTPQRSVIQGQVKNTETGTEADEDQINDLQTELNDLDNEMSDFESLLFGEVQRKGGEDRLVEHEGVVYLIDTSTRGNKRVIADGKDIRKPELRDAILSKYNEVAQRESEELLDDAIRQLDNHRKLREKQILDALSLKASIGKEAATKDKASKSVEQSTQDEKVPVPATKEPLAPNVRPKVAFIENEQTTKVEQPKPGYRVKLALEALKVSEQRKQRITEIDNELGGLWEDLGESLGGLVKLTGEQRAKLVPVVTKMVQLYTEKYAIKGQELIDHIIDHLKARGVNPDKELLSEIIKMASPEVKPVQTQKSEPKPREEIIAPSHEIMPESGTVKIGRFATRVSYDETKVPEEVKTAFKDKSIGEYTVLSDEASRLISEGIVAANDVMTLRDMVLDQSVHPSIRGQLLVAVTNIMRDEYNVADKAGDVATATMWADRMIDFLAEFDEKVSRKAAQMLRFLGTRAAMDVFAPFHHVRAYQREVEEEREKLMSTSTHKKRQKEVKKEAKEIYDSAITKALESPDVQRIIEKNKGTEKDEASTRIVELKKKEKSLIEQWKKARKSSLSATVIPGLTQADIEFGGQLAIVYLEMAAYNVEKAVKKIVKTFSDAGVNLSEENAKKLLPEKIGDKTLGEVEADAVIEKAAIRLASSIFGRVIDKEAKEDPISMMVYTLIGKFKERDIKEGKREDKSDLEKIADAIVNKNEYKEVWAEAKEKADDLIENNEQLTESQREEALNRVQKAYDKATSFTFTEAQVDRAIKRKMAELGVRVNDVVREFYDIQSASRGKLKDALIEEAGLSPLQAKELSEAIERRFDTFLGESKKRLIDKYVGKINDKKDEQSQIIVRQRRNAVSELLELVNIGAFDDPAFREAYATAVGIPMFNKFRADNIKALAEVAQRQKEPIMRHRAIQDLLAYKRQITSLDFRDQALAVWYANVLGNLKTQERNFVGGFSGVSLRLLADSMATGRIIPVIEGAFRGVKIGGRKAIDIWRSGYASFSSQEERIEIPATSEIMTALELKPFWHGLWRAATSVGRTMNAMDMLNATVGKESYAQVLANEALHVSKTKQMFSPSYRKQIREMVEKHLYVDPVTISQIKAEIEADASTYEYTDDEKKLILFERIDRMRPFDITQQASRFGVFSTGNVPSYGTIGALSQLLATALKNIKVPVYKDSKTGAVTYVAPLSLFAAFVKIAGNVATMSLNFVPGVGFVRIFQGGYGSHFITSDTDGKLLTRYHVDITPREKTTIIGQQILGATALAFLWAMSDPGDDDDPYIRVTANGTGDYKDYKSLDGRDWKEYSIGIKTPDGGRVWFPYKYTPLIIPFGIVGFIRDRQRFVKEYADKSSIELLGRALMVTPSFIGDMTAIGSMTEVMGNVIDGISEKDYNPVIKNLQRTISGFYTPGLYRDVVDIMEGSFNMGMDEPIKGASELDVEVLRQRFAGRNPGSVIRRFVNRDQPSTEYVDAYGRTYEKKMFWEEIMALDDKPTETDRMIMEHQKMMGVPAIPSVKTVHFWTTTPAGAYEAIILDQTQTEQNILWHQFLKRRGQYITEAIKDNQGLDKADYVEVMKKAISDATSDARMDIELIMDANPLKEIKDRQIVE